MYAGKYRIYYQGSHWLGMNLSEKELMHRIAAFTDTGIPRKDWKIYKMMKAL
jgi:hypothetical protein